MADRIWPRAKAKGHGNGSGKNVFQHSRDQGGEATCLGHLVRRAKARIGARSGWEGPCIARSRSAARSTRNSRLGRSRTACGESRHGLLRLSDALPHQRHPVELRPAERREDPHRRRHAIGTSHWGGHRTRTRRSLGGGAQRDRGQPDRLRVPDRLPRGDNDADGL